MKSAKVRLGTFLIALLILGPVHVVVGGLHVYWWHHRTPKQPKDQSNPSDNSNSSSNSVPGPLFPPITSFYPPLPYSTSQTAAKPTVAATVAPVDPAADAARKEETAAKLLAWHREQAAAGSPYAQYQMGLHYLNGDGVPKDLRTAKEWFLKSARQGNDDAYEKLKDTDDPETIAGANGRVIASATAHRDFMTQAGFPHGRPGYVIDYKTPIGDGGSAVPDNLTWVKIEEARKLEKWDEPQPPASAKAEPSSTPTPLEASNKPAR